VREDASGISGDVLEGHRFDLNQEAEAIRTQDRCPAKHPVACSNRKSEPYCETAYG
jgi:hypothetical protein